MHLLRISAQGQVAVLAAVEARRRIAAHQALQQHAARQLQAAPGEEALDRHRLATRDAVEIRRHALDLLDRRQVLGELQQLFRAFHRFSP
ncbi:hypothetical protein D3C86_2048720 [compost metagenome]